MCTHLKPVMRSLHDIYCWLARLHCYLFAGNRTGYDHVPYNPLEIILKMPEYIIGRNVVILPTMIRFVIGY